MMRAMGICAMVLDQVWINSFDHFVKIPDFVRVVGNLSVVLSYEPFFIALLPPQEIQDYANQIRQYFSDHYASRGAKILRLTLPCNHLLNG